MGETTAVCVEDARAAICRLIGITEFLEAEAKGVERQTSDIETFFFEPRNGVCFSSFIRPGNPLGLSAWETKMLWTLAVILLVLWVLGGFVFHVAGGLIHILLVIAVVVAIYQLIRGRRVV